MRASATMVSLALLLVAAGPAGGADETRVSFQNAAGEAAGEAVLREVPRGVLIEVTLRGLPPGRHGFHLHEAGVCVPPFESAGGHLNPTGARHGPASPGGPHLGDLPNLVVPESGSVRAEVFAQGVTLAAGRPGSLVDGDGTALVVHGRGDDHRTEPAGNAGDRIACGVVQRPVARLDRPGVAADAPDVFRPSPGRPAPLPNEPDPRSRAAEREAGGGP